MTRGDVVLVADRSGDYTGKLRPAVVVRSDLFGRLDGVTVCPLTTSLMDETPTRIGLQPGAELALTAASQIQIDKITTVRADRIGPSIGRVSPSEMVRVGAALAVYLDLG
jgi:mRNA interferase MazF